MGVWRWFQQTLWPGIPQDSGDKIPRLSGKGEGQRAEKDIVNGLCADMVVSPLPSLLSAFLQSLPHCVQFAQCLWCSASRWSRPP